MVKHIGKDRAGLYKNTQGLHTSTELWSCLNGRWRKKGAFGRINLHRQKLTTEIACHEIAHAGIAWARRVGIEPLACDEGHMDEPEDNERFCYAMGRMMAQFSNHAYRLKLWSS